HRKAGNLIERAADVALTTGNVGQAANFYITAAILLNRAGDGMSALTLIGKARLLGTSPLLSPEERNAIRDRIIETQNTMAAS
ncbi:MAG TPA: hypothetical protein VJ957_08900, partial [Longimicrobiales bacterium]|nr:hypothetical protein [Longimicrobiales bacterium]